MLVPLQLGVGFSDVGTPYESGPRWIDGNLVRWHEGTMRPVGGWRRLVLTSLTGIPRALFAWRENDFQRRLAVGTLSKLYVYTDGSVFDITPQDLVEGREHTVYGVGYGARTFGTYLYGVSRPAEPNITATTWSFANFGEWLLAVQDYDGRLWVWKNDVLSPAELVTTAPMQLLGVHVTPERHVLALGAGGDKRQIAWCSAENLYDWTPSATNSAGFLNLSTAERIVAWAQYRSQFLVMTESEVHVLSYVGYPYIYGSQKVASGCGAVSLHSVVSLDNLLVWMGAEGFYVYDGVVRYLPCAVHDWVFRNFNRTQKEKVYGSVNRRFNEVWWFFPSASSLVPDRYVVWNYALNVWYFGYVGRAAMENSGVYENPIAVTTDGVLYEHEFGWTADGVPLVGQRWVRSGPVEIQNGERLQFVRRLVPDRDPTTAVGFRLHAQEWPETEPVSTPLMTGSPKMDCRVTGRAVSVEIVGLRDEDWRCGRLRVDIVPAGGR